MNRLLHNFNWLSNMTAFKLLFAAVTVALALSNWFVIAWLQDQLQQTNSRIDDSFALLRRAREVHAHYRDWREQTSAIRQQVEALSAKLPSSPQESEFLHRLSALAAANQVTLSDFRRGSIVNYQEFKEIELRVRGAGAYEGMCHWLTELESLPRTMRVSQMTLTAPATAGGNCGVELDLRLRYGLSRAVSSEVVSCQLRSPLRPPHAALAPGTAEREPQERSPSQPVSSGGEGTHAGNMRKPFHGQGTSAASRLAGGIEECPLTLSLSPRTTVRERCSGPFLVVCVPGERGPRSVNRRIAGSGRCRHDPSFDS